MGPFWSNFCGNVGQSGRQGGTFFFVVIVVGVCGLVCLAIFLWCGYAIFGEYFPYVAGMGLMVVAAWLAPSFFRAFKKRERYRIQPLSREEMRRARSKLLGSQTTRKL